MSEKLIQALHASAKAHSSAMGKASAIAALFETIEGILMEDPDSDMVNRAFFLAQIGKDFVGNVFTDHLNASENIEKTLGITIQNSGGKHEQ